MRLVKFLQIISNIVNIIDSGIWNDC